MKGTEEEMIPNGKKSSVTLLKILRSDRDYLHRRNEEFTFFSVRQVKW